VSASAETHRAQRRHRGQSQSVKTTGVGGQERGYDPGKKVKERKRHLLLVDTQGLVLKAKVHAAASVFDRDGIKPLMELVERRFSRAFGICGSMPAITARVRARTGLRRRSWA
jgi:hypothetical protein